MGREGSRARRAEAEEALGEGREVPGLRRRGARVSFVLLQFFVQILFGYP